MIGVGGIGDKKKKVRYNLRMTFDLNDRQNVLSAEIGNKIGEVVGMREEFVKNSVWN